MSKKHHNSCSIFDQGAGNECQPRFSIRQIDIPSYSGQYGGNDQPVLGQGVLHLAYILNVSNIYLLKSFLSWSKPLFLSVVTGTYSPLHEPVIHHLKKVPF